MRQASWIAFLLLAVGLLSYEAALDQQEMSGGDAPVVESLEGEFPPPRP